MDADQRGDPEADGARVDHRVVAGDHAGRLEFADPLVHGGRGEPDPTAQLGVGRPAVLPQRGDDLPVKTVHCGTLTSPGRPRRIRPRPPGLARFVPYYLFTIRQPFEYPTGEVTRLARPDLAPPEEDTVTAHVGERLLTPGEVAALFRVDPKTVTRWATAGRIGSIRTPGGHRRFRESEVKTLLAELTTEATTANG